MTHVIRLPTRKTKITPTKKGDCLQAPHSANVAGYVLGSPLRRSPLNQAKFAIRQNIRKKALMRNPKADLAFVRAILHYAEATRLDKPFEKRHVRCYSQKQAKKIQEKMAGFRQAATSNAGKRDPNKIFSPRTMRSSDMRFSPNAAPMKRVNQQVSKASSSASLTSFSMDN